MFASETLNPKSGQDEPQQTDLGLANRGTFKGLPP